MLVFIRSAILLNASALTFPKGIFSALSGTAVIQGYLETTKMIATYIYTCRTELKPLCPDHTLSPIFHFSHTPQHLFQSICGSFMSAQQYCFASSLLFHQHSPASRIKP